MKWFCLKSKEQIVICFLDVVVFDIHVFVRSFDLCDEVVCVCVSYLYLRQAIKTKTISILKIEIYNRDFQDSRYSSNSIYICICLLNKLKPQKH